jgi:RNA polymerase sigma factor (sigma-70 family)
MVSDTGNTPNTDAGKQFATTHWSVVLKAGRKDATGHRQALETLCRTYWYPLYAYLRRRGYRVDEAEDYTQAFFTRLLDTESLSRADPARGRFRAFLLTSVKNFLANEWDRGRSRKRGGGRQIVPFDPVKAETRYGSGVATDAPAEKLFERSWALTVLQEAFARLRTEYEETNRGLLLDYLKEHLLGQRATTSYRDIAARLDLSEDAVKAAAYRLRVRFRELVRSEIAQTVCAPEEIDQEICDLFAALGG